jgi:hypothetical protein
VTSPRPDRTDRGAQFTFWNEKAPARRPYLAIAGPVIPEVIESAALRAL